MRNIIYSALSILLILSIFSCTTTSPSYLERLPKTGETTNNGIVEFKEPKFKKDPTTLGKSFNPAAMVTGILTEIAGGISLYSMTKDKKSGSTYIGEGLVLLGMCIVLTFLIFIPFSGPKEHNIDVKKGDEKKWVYQLNKYLLSTSVILTKTKADKETIESIFLVPTSSERTYNFSNLDDVRKFWATFPKSRFADSLIRLSLKNLDRQYLPEMIDIIKDDIPTEHIKYHYLRTGTNFDDYISAFLLYPEIKAEAEKKCAEAASNIKDYKTYLRVFPDGASVKSIRQKIENEKK